MDKQIFLQHENREEGDDNPENVPRDLMEIPSNEIPEREELPSYETTYEHQVNNLSYILYKYSVRKISLRDCFHNCVHNNWIASLPCQYNLPRAEHTYVYFHPLSRNLKM